jgi:hypothetical protein
MEAIQRFDIFESKKIFGCLCVPWVIQQNMTRDIALELRNTFASKHSQY